MQDGAVLGKTFTRAALAALAGVRAETEPLLASLVRKEVLAFRPIRARPSTASTASCRTSSAMSPTRRSRSATAGRAPRRGAHLEPPSPTTRTRSSRCSRRTTSTPTRPPPTRTTRPSQDERGDARAGRRARRVARRRDRGAALLEQAAELSEGGTRTRGAARPGRFDGGAYGNPGSAGRLYEAISLHEETGETHAGARVVGRLGRRAFTGAATRRLREMDRALR